MSRSSSHRRAAPTMRRAVPFSLGRRLRYLLQAIPLYLLFGLFRLLPLPAASWLGGRMAYGLGRNLQRRNRLAAKQLAMAMPHLSAPERQKILAAMWDNLGRVVAELAHLPALRRRLADGRIPILGAQAVVEMAAHGQPAMFVSGHLGNWELAPLVAHHLGMPLYGVYRAGNNPWLERLIRAQRDAASNLGRPRRDWQGFGIAKGAEGGKKLLQKMKQRQSIALLIDQRMNDGVAAPFFGQPAMTADAATKLALKYGYPIVMARVVRGRGHQLSVEILPASWPQGFLDAAGGDLELASLNWLTAINQQLESWIREHPAQWLWLHRRW